MRVTVVHQTASLKGFQFVATARRRMLKSVTMAIRTRVMAVIPTARLKQVVETESLTRIRVSSVIPPIPRIVRTIVSWVIPILFVVMATNTKTKSVTMVVCGAWLMCVSRG